MTPGPSEPLSNVLLGVFLSLVVLIGLVLGVKAGASPGKAYYMMLGTSNVLIAGYLLALFSRACDRVLRFYAERLDREVREMERG